MCFAQPKTMMVMNLLKFMDDTYLSIGSIPPRKIPRRGGRPSPVCEPSLHYSTCLV